MEAKNGEGRGSIGDTGGGGVHPPPDISGRARRSPGKSISLRRGPHDVSYDKSIWQSIITLVSVLRINKTGDWADKNIKLNL